jgi:hypothetical protein
MEDVMSEPKQPQFTPEQAFDFLSRMWNPVAFAAAMMPGGAGSGAASSAAFNSMLGPAAMFATLDPKEVERKIQELRTVEGWLSMNVSMLQMTIRTLELQKASLEALRASTTPPPRPAPEARAAPESAPSMPAQGAAKTQAKATPPKPASK